MANRKNYSGSDLPKEWKAFAKSEIARIKKILAAKGCKDFEFTYGFYDLNGYFTSPSGQMYNIFSGDTRLSYVHLVYRTVKSYTDYVGGSNQRVDVESLTEIRLQ